MTVSTARVRSAPTFPFQIQTSRYNLAAMAHLDDFDDHLAVQHVIENSVVALAQAVTFLRGEFLGAGRARVFAQRLDTRQDAPHIR